jgi:hypothetical protein
MKNPFFALSALLCAGYVSGCATIVSGTTQKLSVTTQPSGAIAKVDNNITAQTPGTFTLERRSDHTIEISKEGYKTATVLIKRTFNGMATGNVLIGGIIGGGIDAASGATNKLIPERIDIILEPGTGYSDIPKFANVKDAEFYQKSILRGGRQVVESKDKDGKVAAVVPEDLKAAPGSGNFAAKPLTV